MPVPNSLNKDREDRPLFGEAYAVAERATRQALLVWLETMKEANPARYESLKKPLDAGIRDDLKRKYAIYRQAAEAVGHWGPEKAKE